MTAQAFAMVGTEILSPQPTPITVLTQVALMVPPIESIMSAQLLCPAARCPSSAALWSSAAQPGAQPDRLQAALAGPLRASRSGSRLALR